MGFLSSVFNTVNDFLGSNVGKAVGNIGGGLLSNFLNGNATQKANQANADLQREFAQNSIQWRVQDAQKAGIHPLYALGASTLSASPSFVGNQPIDFGSSFSAMTANPSYNKELQSQTLAKNELELKNLELQNARLAAETKAIMGQSLTPRGGSSVPFRNAGAGAVFQSDQALVNGSPSWSSDTFKPRFAQTWINSKQFHETPTDDYADLMSEGFIAPAREFMRSLNPSELGRRANEHEKALRANGSLKNNEYVDYDLDFSGIIPEPVYTIKKSKVSVPSGWNAVRIKKQHYQPNTEKWF